LTEAGAELRSLEALWTIINAPDGTYTAALDGLFGPELNFDTAAEILRKHARDLRSCDPAWFIIHAGKISLSDLGDYEMRKEDVYTETDRQVMMHSLLQEAADAYTKIAQAGFLPKGEHQAAKVLGLSYEGDKYIPNVTNIRRGSLFVNS
jgi:hypothetical protein